MPAQIRGHASCFKREHARTAERDFARPQIAYPEVAANPAFGTREPGNRASCLSIAIGKAWNMRGVDSRFHSRGEATSRWGE